MDEAQARSINMKLKCADFEQGQPIPKQYTCAGRNMSPPITWDGIPKNTRSLALIVDDPDAPSGIWTHWLAYNIPATQRSLPANIDVAPRLSDGTMQGRNDFRKIGYGGPCPPEGHGPHRYFFRLYALDSELPLEPGASKEDIERAMQGHIIDHTELMGRYQR